MIKTIVGSNIELVEYDDLEKGKISIKLKNGSVVEVEPRTPSWCDYPILEYNVKVASPWEGEDE